MYDITGLAVLVFCGVAVVVAEMLAKRTGFDGPVLLIVGGVALGFLPVTSEIRVPPVRERRRVLVALRDDGTSTTRWCSGCRPSSTTRSSA